MPAGPKTFQHTLQELWTLLRDYARQETVGPLKNLGRQLGLGLAGSVCVALGLFLLGLSLLRLLQEHVQFFDDHEYLQYLAVVVYYLAVMALVARRLRPADAATAERSATGGAA